MIVEQSCFECVPNFDILSKQHWAEFNTEVPEFKEAYLKTLDVVVAKDEDKVVGYVFFAIFQSPYYNTLWCQVDMFYLDKDYRGKGIGKQMFALVEKIAKDSGCSTIKASYNLKSPLDGFYEQLGYNNTHVAVSKEI